MKVLTKLIAAAASFVMIVCLCSCNKDMFDTNYSFDKAMCYGDFDGDDAPEWKIFDIDKWTDYEDGDSIQIETTDGNVYLFHASNCTLIKED